MRGDSHYDIVANGRNLFKPLERCSYGECGLWITTELLLGQTGENWYRALTVVNIYWRLFMNSKKACGEGVFDEDGQLRFES